MDPFRVETGIVAPLPAANVDTDVIMPKAFLKGITRDGLARGVFHDLRFDAEGHERPDFILNRPAYRGARFLVVGPNFGCGSSREHAVWGLKQFGIEALIGTSYAGIFFDNCTRNGLLAIEAGDVVVAALMAVASDPETNEFSIDLPNQTILARGGVFRFDIEPMRKHVIVQGLDAIGLTLESRGAIAAFEARHLSENPWLQTCAEQNL